VRENSEASQRDPYGDDFFENSNGEEEESQPLAFGWSISSVSLLGPVQLEFNEVISPPSLD